MPKLRPLDIAQEFPNYYQIILNTLTPKDKAEAKFFELLAKNIKLLLSKIAIPHENPATNEFTYDNFFSTVITQSQNIINNWDKQHQTQHTLSISLDGHAIQHLLAYLYKELHTILFDDNIHKQMKNPEFHLRRLSQMRENQRILKYLVFGNLKELNLIINVAPANADLENNIKEKINAYTKNIWQYLRFAQKPGFYQPIIGFNIYAKSLAEHQATISPSANSLDHMRFELNSNADYWSFINIELWRQFINGAYRYLPSSSAAEVIKCMGPLLSIPFLQLENKEELTRALIDLNIKSNVAAYDYFGYASGDFADAYKHRATQLAVKDLVENSFYAGAHNRAHNEDNSPLNILAVNQLIPIFADRKRISANRAPLGKYQAEVNEHVIDANAFVDRYCTELNGSKVLWHQTSSEGMYNICRTNFYCSIHNVQGWAVLGSGVYAHNTSRSSTLPFSIFELPVIPIDIGSTRNLRVFKGQMSYQGCWNPVDWPLEKELLEFSEKLRQEAIESGLNFIDPNHYLQYMYDIDIIIDSDVIILNQAVFNTPDLVLNIILMAWNVVACMHYQYLSASIINEVERRGSHGDQRDPMRGIKETFNMLPIINFISKPLAAELSALLPVLEEVEADVNEFLTSWKYRSKNKNSLRHHNIIDKTLVEPSKNPFQLAVRPTT